MSARPDRSLNGWQLEVMAEATYRRRHHLVKASPRRPPSRLQRLRSRISPYGLAVTGLAVMVALPVIKLAPAWLAWLGRVS